MKKAIHRLLILTAFLYFYNANCKSMEANIHEVWKDVVGYEGFYQVSDLGRVRSLSRKMKSRHNCLRNFEGRVISLELAKNGYLRCVLGVNRISSKLSVHRLVAEAFISSRPDGKFINHKNGIKTDNRPENLEWVTRSENSIHAIKTGLQKVLSGESGPSSILTEDQVIEIKSLIRKGARPVDLSKMFNVSGGAIHGIKRGLNWKHVC